MVGLDYDAEVHRSVKNFSPRQGYSRQRRVWHTRWGKVIEKNVVSSSSSLEVEFVSKGWRLSKKLDLQRTSLVGKVLPCWHRCRFFHTLHNSLLLIIFRVLGTV